MKRRILLFVGALILATGAHAQDVADFYRGKTIRMVIGSAAGAGYDLTGRLLTAHLGRHIPGNPSFAVENMPGASSLIMTNWLANSAARDGSVIGMPASGVMLEPRLNILSREGGAAKFDVAQFGWLGTPVQDPNVLWVYDSAPVRSFADLKTTPIIVGATAAGADNFTLPQIVNDLFGAKMKIVPGYKGQNDIFIAAERGEIQGNATGLPNLAIARSDWMRDRKVRILLQFGAERQKTLRDVPTAAELAAGADRDMLMFYAIKFNMARPVATPPGTPPERLTALQAAFDATMQDPAFLDEAKRQGFDIDPLSGKEIGRYMQTINSVPQVMVDRLKKMIAP